MSWPRKPNDPVTFVDEVNDRPKGEYYHDLDLKTNLWCVFHTEHAKAVASFADEGQAKEEADKRNRRDDK